ncbi:gamma-glutamylcyclotransferase [Paramagnetospirillum kuznetsovii]|uniref:Putative gamma-glutamylcyclotransferase n=1 Tax=Paramagnetospirillum kuznetsovii TaxID=2053833 RepID=A0A364NUB0_9PROT|nr:gamma-glutamylcyclotransferase family protein [Paramagnetospirillum kuznetsovii]RAU20679.1 gamma-glutamylcyclotransferase [Paramagnetospirillum kuznetsovii]
MTDDIQTRSMFFFGTLMDVEMLSAVLGRTPAAAEREAAFLRGMRRVYVANRPYPMLIPQAGGRVEGLLVHGLGDRDIERLGYYEGWEYVPEPVTVRTLAGREVATEMFTASSGVLPDSRDWKLDLWQRKHKPEALPKAVAAMAKLGRF